MRLWVPPLGCWRLLIAEQLKMASVTHRTTVSLADNTLSKHTYTKENVTFYDDWPSRAPSGMIFLNQSACEKKMAEWNSTTRAALCRSPLGNLMTTNYYDLLVLSVLVALFTLWNAVQTIVHDKLTHAHRGKQLQQSLHRTQVVWAHRFGLREAVQRL